MSESVKRAILGVRLCALIIIGLALWQMIANLLCTLKDIDPSYLGYYAISQLLRPFCGMLVGGMIWLLSRPLGKLAGRNLDK